jgi:hypothetical protein
MKPLAFAVLAASSAWAQNQPALHARELFYTPPPGSVTSPQPSNTVEPGKAAGTPGQSTAPKSAAKQGTASQATASQAAKSAATAASKTGTTTTNTATTAGQAKGTTQTGDDSGAHLLQAAQVPLGLRYAVLKRDASGKYQDIDPDTPFRAGDRIRLQIDSNTTGYLYVVMQGSSGNWQLLFPSPEVAGGSNQLRKGQSLQIPPGDRGQFVFDETAGTEKIFLVLTRQPEQDLDKLIYSMRGQPGKDDGRFVIAQSTVRDDVVNRLRSGVHARDLIFEKVDTSSAAPAGAEARLENAAYVVNPSTGADARLVVDIALRHR